MESHIANCAVLATMSYDELMTLAITSSVVMYGKIAEALMRVTEGMRIVEENDEDLHEAYASLDLTVSYYLNESNYDEFVGMWQVIAYDINHLHIIGTITDDFISTLLILAHAPMLEGFMRSSGPVHDVVVRVGLDDNVKTMISDEYDTLNLIKVYHLYEDKSKFIELLDYVDMDLAVYLIRQGHHLTAPIIRLMSTTYKLTGEDLDVIIGNYSDNVRFDAGVTAAVLCNASGDDDHLVYHRLLEHTAPDAQIVIYSATPEAAAYMNAHQYLANRALSLGIILD